MLEPTSRPPVHRHHHAVQFYGNDGALFTTVAGFLSEGLVAGQPAILVATAAHGAAIVKELSRRLIDVEEAQRTGSLVLLDAQETLDTFMVGNTPDAQAFERTIGGVIEDTLRSRPGTIVRAYGEMVDLLWKEGRQEAAIQLEILWNQLAMKHSFALLCGYSIGNFYKLATQFQEVCRVHTEVLSSDADVIVLESKRAARIA